MMTARLTVMNEGLQGTPVGPSWLILLPPTPVFMLASALLTAARLLYRVGIVRFDGLLASFRLANALSRIGMASWRRCRMQRQQRT